MQAPIDKIENRKNDTIHRGRPRKDVKFGVMLGDVLLLRESDSVGNKRRFVAQCACGRELIGGLYELKKPGRTCAECGRRRAIEKSRARRVPIKDRLMRHVTTGEGCWNWNGAIMENGYGVLGNRGRGSQLAHRISYEVFVGPIPEGMVIDHLCRNRRCVNPSHLEPVTSRINNLRGIGLAAQFAAKTHCPQGHPYDQPNTYINPNTGGRHCRACHAATERERRKRKQYANPK